MMKIIPICKFFDKYCDIFYKGKTSVDRFDMIFFCKGNNKKCKLYEAKHD